MDTSTTVPTFWRQLSGLYADSVSHAFILHGNVHDYVPVSPAFYTPLETFILNRLSASGFDIIALVDPAQGLRFPVPAHRDLAVQILGVKPGSPSAIAQLLAPGAKPPMPQRELLHLITQILDQLLTTPWQVTDAAEPRPGRVAVVFSYSELLFPDSDLRSADGPVLARLLQWARSPQVAAARHLLFLVSESLISMHSELRRASSRWEPIGLVLPDQITRQTFLAHLGEQYDDLVFLEGLDTAAAAAATGALTLLQVEDVAFRALGAGGLDLALITERKEAIIRQEFADVLRVAAARFDLAHVGGYEYLKTFFRQRLIAPWRGGRLPFGGLLMPGPAGTGKTQLAEALAGSAGVPFVTFDLSKILGEYVGNSERNLERALSAVLSLAPCVLFIDEIDQLVSRGEHGGNGVDNRVFARLLTFLEDPARRQAGVLLVAATNRPDLLDDALRSRFDRTAPVLPPTAEDRAAIGQTLARQLGLGPLGADDLLELVDGTEGWVGRNVRDLMAVVAELVPDAPTLNDAISDALAIYRPKLRDTQQMTQLALAEISDLRLVPPHYRQVAAQETIPAPMSPESGRRRRAGGVL